MVSMDDMDKFQQKEMKKIRPTKNTWHDWWINYIPEPIKKCLLSSTTKQTEYGRRKNHFILKKKKKEIEDGIVRDKWTTSFETEQQKEERKKLGRKKQYNQRLFKHILIRDIKTCFEQQREEDYYKPETVNNFWRKN